MTITVTIDSLVIHELSRAEAETLQADLATSLESALRDHVVSATAAQASPAIAQAIVNSLGGER